MRLGQMFVGIFTLFCICLTSAGGAELANLLSLQEGTMPLVLPPTYGGWDAQNLLDDDPTTGWACEANQINNNVFVFEMAEPAAIDRFEFDTAATDTEGAGARQVEVEISDAAKDKGYSTALSVDLKPNLDKQSFNASQKPVGRFVRLTIRNNHGSTEWTELFSFRGYGLKPAAKIQGDISGTYETSYSRFHVRQQATSLLGCYEYNEGLLDGAIEGRVMKITWREGESSGPALMIFAPDTKSFRGFWWRTGSEKSTPSGVWDGKKISTQVGTCPHWSGSLEGELQKKINLEGRARLYGILFEVDSAAIRGESKPVLNEVVKLLQEKADWKFLIEGHTDASGSDQRNQTLSQQRADAVKAHLVAAGIAENRLKTAGFGKSKPVADNATELGRAQNRRVELVRQP